MRRLIPVFAAVTLTIAAYTPAWAAYPVVKSWSVYRSAANATSHTIPAPVPAAVSGDLVVVFTSTDAAPTDPTLTFPSTAECTGNAWTTLQAATQDAAAAHESMYVYCVLDGTLGSFDITIDQSESFSAVVMVISAGTYTGIPAIGTAVTPAAGTSIDPPSLTSGFGAVDTLWVVAATADTNGFRIAATSDVTWVAFSISNGAAITNHANVGVSLKYANAASMDPGTDVFTLSGSDDSTVNTIAIQGAAPAGGGGGTGPFIFGR